MMNYFRFSWIAGGASFSGCNRLRYFLIRAKLVHVLYFYVQSVPVNAVKWKSKVLKAVRSNLDQFFQISMEIQFFGSLSEHKNDEIFSLHST